MKPLTREQVSFEIKVESDDMPYVGNCSAIDDETDAENERWVREQLDQGNDLAWCTVLVVARPRDGRLASFEGFDSLCGISCVDRKDLEGVIRDHAMEEEALDHLNKQLGDAHSALCGGGS